MKYFVCLSEIRTPIICFYLKITLLILRNIKMLNIYIYMFLYSVRVISVGRSFTGDEIIQLILSVLPFKSFIIPYYIISSHVMY